MILRDQNDIMKEWSKNSDAPLVSIRCLAYNHENFISQALDGFLMQETDFPFEIVIHDDASTDNTASIIRKYELKYPKIVKPIYEKENQYSKRDGSLSRIVNAACKGKYIAYCEGDDYWIDSKKLKKQVDILENDDSCSLIHSDFIMVDKDSNEITNPYRQFFLKEAKRNNALVSLFNQNYIMTLSVVVRRSLWFNPIFINRPASFDYAIFFSAAFEGNIRYLPSRTCAYRINPTSITHTQGSMLYSGLYKIYQYFAELFFVKKKKKVSKLDYMKILFYAEANFIRRLDFKWLLRVLRYNKIGFVVLPISIVRATWLKFLGHYNGLKIKIKFLLSRCF